MKQLRAGLFWVPVLAAAAAILAVRGMLGFQFPVPWPDETGFVAPAFDFARNFSFFDPGMNPDRVVMWMPPGYMLLLAAMFRLFGYSFALARWVSAVACLTALGCSTWLAWRCCGGWRRVGAGWAVAAAFVTPFMLIDANIARMEMLFAAVMLLALAAMVTGRIYIAVALVAMGAMVHFNAVYFVPPVLLPFAATAWRRQLRWPEAADRLALAAAAAMLLLYAGYVALNWPGFRADIGFQFAFKHWVAQNDPAHPLWPVLGCGALAVYAVWRHGLHRAGALGLFGLAFVVMAHNGHEIWYDYGQPLGFALMAVALLGNGQSIAWPQRLLPALAVLMLCATGWRITDILRPLLPHRAMLHRSIVAPAGIAHVRAFIATLKPGATVNFGWSGMELFFLDDLARVGARWTIIRHSVTEVWPLRAADWRVVCDSSEWPPFLFHFDIDHPRHGIDSGCDILPGTTPQHPR